MSLSSLDVTGRRVWRYLVPSNFEAGQHPPYIIELARIDATADSCGRLPGGICWLALVRIFDDLVHVRPH